MSWFYYIIGALVLSLICLAGISAFFLYWIACNDSCRDEDYPLEYTPIEENNNEVDNSGN